MIEDYDKILRQVDDLVSCFLYYDRKEDEDLPLGTIETAIASGVITVDEISQKFDSALRAGISSS